MSDRLSFAKDAMPCHGLSEKPELDGIIGVCQKTLEISKFDGIAGIEISLAQAGSDNGSRPW